MSMSTLTAFGSTPARLPLETVLSLDQTAPSTQQPIHWTIVYATELEDLKPVHRSALARIAGSAAMSLFFQASQLVKALWSEQAA